MDIRLAGRGADHVDGGRIGAVAAVCAVWGGEWHLSGAAITGMFAIYVATLLVTLLVGGRLSDRVGRRPVLFTTFAVTALAMLVFAGASSPGDVLLARAIQGVGTGLGLSGDRRRADRLSATGAAATRGAREHDRFGDRAGARRARLRPRWCSTHRPRHGWCSSSRSSSVSWRSPWSRCSRSPSRVSRGYCAR